MGLSGEESRALEEMDARLSREDPELDALLSGASSARGRGPRGRDGLLQVWLMLMLLTCAVFMMGIVLMLSSGEYACADAQSRSCENPADAKVRLQR
ncbi:DUF3040 domain-containing protein [Nonomuraea fuscirosea]|uniref:DUF3040 domain-containing protein n=1 Tax=Nonomuraea fuscirosea TaxID=1291556 RepID=UPI00343AD358